MKPYTHHAQPGAKAGKQPALNSGLKTNAVEPELSASYQPPSQALFQKLETLEKELDSTTHTGHNRWMVPYADLLTLLLGLFLVLFSTSKMELQKLDTAAKAAKSTAAATALKSDPKQSKQTAKAEQAALSAQLQKQFKMSGVEIREQERGVVISLKDSILFSAGSADLSPAAQKTLKQLSIQLQQALHGEARPIRVEGHTDNTPIRTARYPSNWELSTARATNIVRYLIDGKQFPADKLSAAGYGEFRPVAQNSSIEGKQKNRRVDIVVLNANMAQQEPPAESVVSSDNGGPSKIQEE